MSWWRTHPPRERRALLAGAMVTALALGYARLARPLVAHVGSVRSTLARERDLEARERALLVAADGNDTRLIRASEALGREMPRVFEAADTLAATAALSRYVRTLAERTGAALQGAEPGQAEPGPGALTAIRIRLRAAGDLQALLELVDALQSGPRLVRIAALGITPEQGLPAWESPEREALLLAADLTAWALIGEAPE